MHARNFISLWAGSLAAAAGRWIGARARPNCVIRKENANQKLQTVGWLPGRLTGFEP